MDDLCHLKNSELDKKFQKDKGRAIQRGDEVKDESGSYAAFTGQGSSASHMTAAKVLDVISRFRDCADEASDAVSAYTQVKMVDRSRFIEITQSECPTIRTRLPRSRCPKSWDNIHGQDYCVSDTSTNSYTKKTGRKYLDCDCLLMHREKGLFLSVYVDDSVMAGKKKKRKPRWKIEETPGP